MDVPSIVMTLILCVSHLYLSSKPSKRIRFLLIARRAGTPTGISSRDIRVDGTHGVPIAPSLTHAPVAQILAFARMLASGVAGRVTCCPLGDFPLDECVHTHGARGVRTMTCALSAGGVVGAAAAGEAGVVVVGACDGLARGRGAGFASATAAEAKAGRVDTAVAGGGCGGHVAVS